MARERYAQVEPHRRWYEPGVGAEPIPPYPGSMLLRWSLVAIYLAYLSVGGLGSDDAVTWFAATFVPLAIAVNELLFFTARHDSELLLRRWRLILPFDALIFIVAALPGATTAATIAGGAMAMIFAAATMFRPPYVVALALATIAGLEASRALVTHDALAATPIFMCILIATSAAIAAQGSRKEQALRARLKNAFDAARQRQAVFDAFAGHAPAVLAIFDADGRSVLSSEYLARLAPEARDGASVGFWRQHLDTAGKRALDEALDRAHNGEATQVDFNFRSGTESVQMSGSFFPLGTWTGAIVMDVTRERDLAAQVVRAQQMETVGTLAGGIAHDFNNLLTAILGNVYLATELLGDHPARECLDDARRAGERGAELVRQLLAYSRPALEDDEPVDLKSIIDETAALARPGLTPMVELAVEATQTGLVVRGSSTGLQQALLNLLVNARDAMPHGGRIAVALQPFTTVQPVRLQSGTAPPGSYQLITVSDTGHGIPAHLIDRIFEPFVTTKEVGRGTGLGLSTTLSAIRAHQGFIGVESREGQGTTFRVLLPAVAAEDARAAA